MPLQSSLVWDPAHIGHFEELWLLRRVGGRSAVSSEYDDLYDAFAHPRGQRGRLPILPPEAARAGLRVESWCPDRAGDFALSLVLGDPVAES